MVVRREASTNWLLQTVTRPCPVYSDCLPPSRNLEINIISTYTHSFPPPAAAACPRPGPEWSSPQRGAVIRKCKFSPEFHFIYTTRPFLYRKFSLSLLCSTAHFGDLYSRLLKIFIS